MRIIAGKFKSRIIKQVPSKDTRETADKVKGAVFNSIAAKLNDAYVLDLFAGSGSYGLESISRNAKHVVFNDVKQIALKTIYENIDLLDIKAQSTVWKLDYKDALNKLKELPYKLDIVFIDPPYKLDIYEDILNRLYDHLNDDAYIILEMDKDKVIDIEAVRKYNLHKEKIYGSKKIMILIK